MKNDLKTTSHNPRPAPWRHLDYRDYLREFYGWKKSQRAGFSYRAFSLGTGVQSPNYLKLIIDGDRKITRTHATRIARFCRLDRNETHYFLALVDWNQATRPTERERAWNRIVEARKFADHVRISNSQLAVVMRWQAVALLEMIRVKGFRAEVNWIRSQFSVPVTNAEIESDLRSLTDVGLVVRKGNTYEISRQNFKTEDDIPKPCVRAYHRSVTELGMQSLETVDLAEREFISTTLAVREADIPRLKEKLRQVRDEILSEYGDVNPADRVYQFNLQLFPITKKRSDRD